MAYVYLRWVRKPWSRVVRHLIENDEGSLPAVAVISDVRDALNDIKWAKDKWIDYISYPRHIYRTKKGDCDDFAVLSCTLLDRLKINGSILSVLVEARGKSHAVCVFWYENDLCIFDNSRFKVQPAGQRNINSVVHRVAKGSKVLAWSMEDCRGEIAIVRRGNR